MAKNDNTLTAPAPDVVAAPESPAATDKATADSFIEKHAGDGPRARYMRSKLPKNRDGIRSFVNEFANTDSKAATMRRELLEFTPEA